ncbi:Phage integrase [Rhodospirillum rubrum ATCC 11170]|uniref:Phage integrase n=1 Tax=Rhodospirillum rubrum (strain ATCC 11170 / ATH 1.1.1 / DSM 467 / LMG 4362 / NCIMB 8255 / S1) TaxID=269796 RepID=Q2RTK4_RHORT|nr:Phage integrase [Rhodospirillum rubrum ATCC 11170]MBK5954129.1 integrase [Rhodospirillum rubrum]HAQ00617.1 integrase [Rhodospirillum rubrum]HCF18537.1 integrase [Rhodospirillum rubrum]
MGAIGAQRVQKLYDGMRVKTPAKANAVITMLRILLTHAVREQMVATNVAKNPGLISLPFSGKLWPVDAVSLFVEVADRMGWHSVGTAVAINHWIGQRQGDILAMKRGAYRDGVFYVTQNKTSARVAVPHSPWVQRRVDAELDRQKARKIGSTTTATLLLCDSTNQPWREDHFRHVFAEIRSKAADLWHTFFLDDGSSVAMLDLQFMHLRHTAVTELAIAGCTVLQIAGITGHTPKSVTTIINRYLVASSDLAAAAAHKRLAMGNDIAALATLETFQRL